MIFYAAPMEGITSYTWRNCHAAAFGGIERYFTPFISPNKKTTLRTREMRDVLPENNNAAIVPQILTNNAEDFLICADVLRDMGYNEVNLNLGCPSGTVTAKRKGSGILQYPDELSRLLDEIFSRCEIAVSVKTRSGYRSHDEAETLIEIYNRYPLSELIIHPRVREEFYKGMPNLDAFSVMLEASRAPVCYNGDIFTKADYEAFTEKFPSVSRIMLGRGIIANPALAGQLSGANALTSSNLLDFHNDVLERYNAFGYGDKNVLFKMKELWAYFSQMFPDSKKQIKAIMKSQTMADYVGAVRTLFAQCALDGNAGYPHAK